MAAAKKPRLGKSFDEHTIAELHEIVKKFPVLERQLAAKEEELNQLREVAATKKALEKQLKESAGELEAKRKQVDKLRAAAEDSDDSGEQATRAKASICKQFLVQMLWEKEWADKLHAAGREISAYLPNVDSDLLKALNLDRMDHGITKKNTGPFFKGVQPSPAKAMKQGMQLGLVGNLEFRYVKSSEELKVTTSYKLMKVPKEPPKVPGRKRGRKADAGGGDGDDGDQEDEHEEGGDAAGSVGGDDGSGEDVDRPPSSPPAAAAVAAAPRSVPVAAPNGVPDLD